MPELPSRIDGEIIEAQHMNDATIRAVQRYDTEATRDSLNPAPENGQPAYIVNIQQLQIWNGSSWRPVGEGYFLLLSGGTMTGDINVNNNNIIGIPDVPSGGSAAANANYVVVEDNKRVLKTGDEMSGDLSLPTHTLLSKDAQFGSGQEIQMLEDGSAVIGNGLKTTAIVVEDVGSAAVAFNRTNAPVQWRFRIDPGGVMLLESSLDGSSWQTEDSWTRP